MPELPEVETTRRGIEPHLLRHTIVQIIVRQPLLRWPIPAELSLRFCQQQITAVNRRGKYLLLATGKGTLIFHLGMSGSLRILPANTTPGKHDHVDFIMSNGMCLRFTDPRRFGCLLCADQDPEQHFLLKDLGPEPFSAQFSCEYLFQRSRKRKTKIKTFLMDNKTVVGVGNIYANEALFAAGIKPTRAAGSINYLQYQKLYAVIKKILQAAINRGGTTLRDFTQSDGKPGYFKQKLRVYDREGLSCTRCEKKIKSLRIAQRTTYYCPGCQV